MSRGIAIVVLCVLAGAAGAAVFEERTFAAPALEARYRTLVAELRCLVCQNQSLAESEAGLARDLRDQVHVMLGEGRTDAEIVDYMTARYGDFVLYRPPLRPATIALWVGPFLLGALGLWVLARHVGRQRAATGDAPLSAVERERLARAIESEPPP